MDNEEKLFTSKDYRFTYKNGYLYAFCMRPDSEIFAIDSLRIKGERDIVTGTVEVLGDHSVTGVKRDGKCLTITLDKKPESDKPVCFKIEMS